MKSWWSRFRALDTKVHAGIVAVVVVVVIAAAASGGSETDQPDEVRSTTTVTIADDDEVSVTTAAESEVEVWTYDTFSVECDDDTACTDGVPDPVGIIGLATDCAGVQRERDFWASQVGSNNSDEHKANAAAYVAYADDKLAEREC